MWPQQLNSLHRKTGALREFDDVFLGRQFAAGKYLLADETHRAQIPHGDRGTDLAPIVRRMLEYCVQEHPAVVRQHAVGHVEERPVSALLERLERADADDAIDRFVALLPALQSHIYRARRRDVHEPRRTVLTLVPALRNSDHVAVMLALRF